MADEQKPVLKKLNKLLVAIKNDESKTGDGNPWKDFVTNSFPDRVLNIVQRLPRPDGKRWSSRH